MGQSKESTLTPVCTAVRLALRWYREQRAFRRGEPLGRTPFKCGPEENRRAWEAIATEFFGGADAVPRCA
jgi:hypothetical protein